MIFFCEFRELRDYSSFVTSFEMVKKIMLGSNDGYCLFIAL